GGAGGGGGGVGEGGRHGLDWFLDVLGDVADVQAHVATLRGGYQAEDCATLALRFGSGAHGTLPCFFGTSWVADDFAVLGTRGRLLARPLNGERLVVATDRGQRVETHPPPTNLHAPLVADFVSALRHRRHPVV